MKRSDKEKRVEQYDAQIKEAAFAILTEHGKMNVKAVETLRDELAATGVKSVVIKNTLAKIVFERNGLEEMCEYLTGPSFLFLGEEEIAPAAKALKKAARKHPGLEVKAVLFDGAIYPSKDFATFTSMPTKDEVRSQLLGVLMAPAGNFVRVIGPASRFLTVLQQYADKQD